MATLANYLAFKRSKLAELRKRLQEPAGAPFELKATARIAGGSGVRPVRVREFTIVTDSGPALAGYDLGPSAPELLLSALASCLAHTYLIVAADRGIAYDTLEVEVRGSIDFCGVLEVGADAPIPPQQLRYEARIGSQVGAQQLAQLQREVERLCPVLQALTQPLVVEGVVVKVEQSGEGL
jgi:uncharacterized OsmC-like protein